jgi:UMF1 family MFS transporter
MSKRAEQRGWYFYDWANSTFSTTVVTLLLGPYLTELAHAGADAGGFIHPFGVSVDYRSYWSYLIALSVMTQVAVLPVLGAIADYSHRKKFLLGLFAYLGAAATIAMYRLEDGMWAAGGVLFLISNLVFGASVVVYNSFLPEIAAPQERDAVSSKGWGIGYLGGGLLLALNLVLLRKAPDWGISQPLAIRINLASAGLWWALFTIIPLRTLRNRIPVARPPAGRHIVVAGFRQILSTLKGLPRYPQTLVFLLAYLVYNDAIQAVITLASQFGSEELKMPMSQLAMAILMIQFVAFAGSILFNYVARAVGAKRAVMIALVVWAGIIYAMYALVYGGTGFFILGAVAAVVLGGSQALSRSLFSQMIPKGQEAEFFSIYEVSDKGTSWLAPLIFGLSLQWTRSFRAASLSLLFFFVVGFGILARVNVPQGAREAGNELP